MPRSYYDDDLSILEGGARATRINDEGEWEYVDKYGRTQSEVLEQYQDRVNRLNAISGVYQRADRIITGQDVVVEVTSDPEGEVASNTGKVITFNASLIDDLSDDKIMSLHGLNYHEVSHLLFSPRAGSNLAQYIKANKLGKAFFLLEEARAENLLVTKYPITRLFLEASINDYLLKDKENIGSYFPLVTGRKYLPLELRQLVADKARELCDPDTLKDIHSIIHEYRDLVFPRDFDKAKELSTRLSRYVGLDEDKQGGGQGDQPEGQGQWKVVDSHNFLKEGRPANTTEQTKLQDRASKNKTESENLDREPKGGDGVGFGEGGADPDKVINAEQVVFDNTDSLIAQLLNERMESIRNDRFVKRELSDTRKAILGSDEMRVAMRATNFIDMSVSPTAQVTARRFGQELERLVFDQDPKWDTERPYGKLIPKRTMTPDINAIGRVFDRWDTGNDRTDIEAVVLLDNSSSMGSTIKSVCETSWVIKRGVEAIQGDVTIYSFNQESRLLYSSDERAKPNTFRFVSSHGNTNPIRGLMEAERLFATTKKSVKLLFIVTDGEWAMDKECDKVIQRLNESGVFTCVVFLDDYKHYKSILDSARDTTNQHREYYVKKLASLNHGAKLFRAVAKTKDVVGVATTIVKELVSHDRTA